MLYKASDGSSYGTKNLLDHVKLCNGGKQAGQLQLSQCMMQKSVITKQDAASLRRLQAEYCADGYNLFQSVEHTGRLNLLQACVDLGTSC